MIFLDSQIEVFDVDITVYLGNMPVQQMRFQAPRDMIEMQFKSLAMQIAREPQPMRIEMKREEQIYDPFSNKFKIVPYILECKNYIEPED